MKHDDLIGALAHALPGLSRPVKTASDLTWWIGTSFGERLAAGPRGGGATLRLRHPWLDIEAPLRSVVPADPFGLLCLQSALPGGLKVVPPHTHVHARLALRAELPVGLDTANAHDWLRRQVGLVSESLEPAVGQVRTGGERINLVAAPDAAATPAGKTVGAEIAAALDAAHSDAAPFDAEPLAERCTAGGWRASVALDAASGRSEVHVELASRTAPRRAVLSRSGAAIRAAVTLDTGALGGRSSDSQQAVAALLMRATGALRWVRGFVGDVGEVRVGGNRVGGIGAGAAGFECLLAQPSDDQALALALDALTTACELHGREAEALAESAPLAQLYLAIQSDRHAGRPARRAAPAPGRPVTAPVAPNRVSPDRVPDPGAVDLVLV